MASAAEPLMEDVPPPATAEEAVALLRAGEAAYGAGRPDEARRAWERLAESGMLAEWAWFFLGRLRRDLGQDEEALHAFGAAIDASPSLFWAHYERTALLQARREGAGALAGAAEGLLAAPWEELSPPHVEALEAAAHTLWDEGRRDQAAAILARLWPSEALGGLGLARLVEGATDKELAEEAQARLDAAPEVDAAALRELADHYSRAGDLQHEIEALEKRRRLAPGDLQTWLALTRATARAGEAERARALLEEGTSFPARPRAFAQLIVELELGEIDAAFLSFRRLARLWGEVAKFPGIRLAYALSDRLDVARRSEVLALLKTAHDDADVALVELNAAIRDQRWDDARALYDARLADMPDPPASVRLARVDLLAFQGRLEEAAALLDAERVEGVVQPAFLRPTLRILGELGRWNDALDAGLANLAADASFEHFLSVLVRAARTTGRSEELLDRLLALPRPLDPARLDAVCAVAEDVAEQGRAVLDRLCNLPLPAERCRRIALKLRGHVPAAPAARDLCIYYCADRAYLEPALVSLTALAMGNAEVARRADFRLVVDREVVPQAQDGAEAIARRLGLALEVVDASAIVSSAERLRTAYGVFTGGQSLSLAAYYRIFYARHLLDTGGYTQALYVDSDTLVRGGLQELFDAPMTAPLMARPEIDRPEVRHATAIHALSGRYFNSGVLRFDMAHPELGEALDRAIAAAIDPEARLIFQDQCALNIAFDGRVEELPQRFNHFTPPIRSGDAIGREEAVIVHFLDRPKPWDGLYRQSAREWFDWYDLVGGLRGGEAGR